MTVLKNEKGVKEFWLSSKDKFPFGKYKGLEVVDAIRAYSDYNYVRWAHRNSDVTMYFKEDVFRDLVITNPTGKTCEKRKQELESLNSKSLRNKTKEQLKNKSSVVEKRKQKSFEKDLVIGDDSNSVIEVKGCVYEKA